MKPFHFKKFSLSHHRSTMKVGTDSILLGSWCGVDNPKQILDIGTGCGILALMLACRCDASIDAIEIDIDSGKEAHSNFIVSPFANRLELLTGDFKIHAKTKNKKYDLIISNPPFFNDGLLSENEQRRNARHTVSMSHKELLVGVSEILVANAKFCIVIPYNISEEFIANAASVGLFPHRILVVHPKENHPPNRINIEFSRTNTIEPISDNIIIRNSDNSYTEEYRKLVGEFLIRI